MKSEVNASASAEANGIKLSDNSVSFNFGEGKGAFPGKILRSLNPVWYEKREAAAREIAVDSLIKTAHTIREACPVMTERRAVMEAMGYRVTNEQADNFAEVSGRAASILEQRGANALPASPETRDAIVEGASHAYSEDARELWARIMAGELESPGAYSKRAMSILSDMRKYELELFVKFCSMTVRPKSKNGLGAACPVFCEDDGGTSFNDGAITYAMKMQLESLGLIDSSSKTFYKIKAGDCMPFVVNNRILEVRCLGDGELELGFSPALTTYGLELAGLCEFGTAEGIEYHFAKHVIDEGEFSVSTRIAPEGQAT